MSAYYDFFIISFRIIFFISLLLDILHLLNLLNYQNIFIFTTEIFWPLIDLLFRSLISNIDEVNF